MKNSHWTELSAWMLSLALIVGMAGCDIISNDKKPELDTTTLRLYKPDGGAAAINISDAFPDYSAEGVTGSGASYTSFFNDGSDRFLLYRPENGEDKSFQIELMSKSGERMYSKVEFHPRALASCGKVENFTQATVANNSRFSADLLQNEDFCGLENVNTLSVGSPEIVRGSDSDVDIARLKALVSENSVGDGGDAITFTFDPKDNFTGTLEIRYAIGVNWYRDPGAPGEIDPDNYEYYSSHTVVIEVTD